MAILTFYDAVLIPNNNRKMGRKREYNPPLIQVIPFRSQQGMINALLNTSLESLSLKGYPPQTDGLLPTYYRTFIDFKPTFPQAYAVQREMELNLIGLHWAIKLSWNTKHKLPVSERWASPFKPLGVFFQHIYMLCKECHPGSRIVGVNVEYLDAVDWFQAFFLEWLSNETIRTLRKYDTNNNENTDNDENTNNDNNPNKSKCTQIRSYQDFWNQLDNYQNPAIYGSHFKELIKVAILMAERSDVFRKTVFKPFVKSGRDMVNMYSHPAFKRHFLDKKGEMSKQTGRGKSKVTIKPP